MTTLAEAIDAALDANWSGAGGTEPTISNTQDLIDAYPEGMEYILVLGYSLKTDMRRVNDTYAHKTHTIDLECSTSDATNTEDRLNEIVEEVERILSTDGVITGYDTVRVTRVDRRITPQDRHVYKALVTVELHEFMAASATAAGSASSYNLGAALMLGAANAAWVPLAYLGTNVSSYMLQSATIFINQGANDMQLNFVLTQPTNKGSLKLYISNLKIAVQDADADDYITAVTIYGHNGTSRTQLDTDTTDHTAASDKTFAGAVMPAAAIDVSGYQSVAVFVSCVNTGGSELDIANVRMECYYDT